MYETYLVLDVIRRVFERYLSSFHYVHDSDSGAPTNTTFGMLARKAFESKTPPLQTMRTFPPFCKAFEIYSRALSDYQRGF